MTDRIKVTLEIHAPVGTCYRRWHEFEKFPHYMKNVKEVAHTVDNRWHWVVRSPIGRDIKWDAVIDSDEKNRMLSWHTVDQSQVVNMQGTIRFDEIAPNRTEMTCLIQYHMPAGPLGEAVAELVTHPRVLVEEDLNNFKHLVEGTNVPAEKARMGKTLASTGVGGTSGSLSQGVGKVSEAHGYAGPYDLEEALLEEGIEPTEIDDPAIRDMIFEENPYLGVEGAWEEKDEWAEPGTDEPVESDVFTDSMDIYNEDLENFTEDLDDDINSGIQAGENSDDYVRAMQNKSEASRASKRTQSEL